jgi:hypothetical protein
VRIFRSTRTGEKEPDAHLANGAPRGIRRQIDRDAPGFQQIGASALARNRAIAVLGHVHPGARHHECGHRGDVKCVGAVAPGAAGVEQGLAGVETGLDGDGHLPHGARETHQFLDGFALHLQGDQESRDARLAGLAAQNNPHGGFGVGGRKIVRRDQPGQVGQKGHDKMSFL